MSDDRLDAVLSALREAPSPAIACDEHAALVMGLGDPDVALDIDAFAEVMDCDACAAALDAHPFLASELLDLPLPPPAVPVTRKVRRRWAPMATLALAAAVLLVAWATAPAPVIPVAVVAPGPTDDGHAAYAFVDLAAPRVDGRSSYSWVERPASAETYRFEALDPGPLASNYTYSPWSWR